MKTQRFYKIARPDGFDFYTGKTINYRENIGKRVVCPNYNQEGDLCSSAFIYASKNPNDCFIGGDIPCSVYLVEGTPIKQSPSICAFRSLKIVEELNPQNVFKWRYDELCNLNFNKPPERITKKHIDLLKEWIIIISTYIKRRKKILQSFINGYEPPLFTTIRYYIRNILLNTWEEGEPFFAYFIPDFSGFSYAYIGYILQPLIPSWKEEYPYQCGAELFKMGLIPTLVNNEWNFFCIKSIKSKNKIIINEEYEEEI